MLPREHHLDPTCLTPVDIFFKTRKLAKVLNGEAVLLREFGARNGREIRLRLAVLSASVTLDDVSVKPPDRRHQLKGDLKGCFAVDAEHPFRIVFEPATTSLPRKADGGLDLKQITAITILDIIDYH